MNTRIITKEQIEEGARVLREGGLVAFPTETVYGLGANALDENAAKKTYAAKGRPSDNPLIVHVADLEQVAMVVREIPQKARDLMDAFWPGPLTIIMKKADCVPFATTGGLDTVAVRMPDNGASLALIKEAGLPVSGPSANTSGKPSPTTAKHVFDDMNGRIEMILDDGPVGIGVESTIIDMSTDTPTILRPGAITKEELSEVLQTEVEIDPAICGMASADLKPKAPGMKYKHYAPKAEMYIYMGEDEVVADKINALVGQAEKERKKAGVLCCEETEHLYTGGIKKCLGRRAEPLSLTHRLYGCLREFDDDEVDVIYSEGYEESGIGFALMNRMRKSAAGRVEKLVKQ